MKQCIPSKEQTYEQLGLLLLLTQDVERRLATLIGTVYPKGPPTWEELSALKRSTLGGLLRKLKERVEIEPTFEDRLKRFLEGRNLFAHRLHHEPWFDLESEPGRDAVWRFIERYSNLLQDITLVVTSAIFSQMKAAGMPETD